MTLSPDNKLKVSHEYKLLNYTFTHPNTAPRSFDKAIRCIFYRRRDLTLNQQKLMLVHNLEAYLDNVKTVVENGIAGLNPTLLRQRIDFYIRFLDEVYLLHVSTKDSFDDDVFTTLYGEISGYLMCVYDQYVAKGA